jgi:hypothetical protein
LGVQALPESKCDFARDTGATAQFRKTFDRDEPLTPLIVGHILRAIYQTQSIQRQLRRWISTYFI